MKVVFAGTPSFALPTLQALLAAGHEVAMVWTQPDRPAGRGMKVLPGPVAAYALAHHLPLRQCRRWDDQELAVLAAMKAEVLVVVAYGLLLPEAALALPTLGGINVHASLLPRWRGAAPILRAIQAGDEKTGVGVMAMEATLDTGAIFAQREEIIRPDDTSGTLSARLAQMGASLLVDTLPHLATRSPIPQSAAGAIYAKKLAREETLLHWERSAAELARWVRALQPAPGALTFWENQRLKIHRALPMELPSTQSPGVICRVSGEGVDVATGDGQLRLLALQLPGARPLAVDAFLQGAPMRAGMQLGQDFP